MATKRDGTGLGSTMSKGCDETFEYLCDLCITEDLHLEADGYCQTCIEYLCKNCFKYHAKCTATKHHTLLDKAAMPKTKVGLKTKVGAKVTDPLTETCPKHTDKLLEYVCNVHNEICCVVCMTLNHPTCTDRSYVPDVSDNVITSGEYKRLQSDLDHLVSVATKQQRKINVAENDNDALQTDSLTKIKSLRKRIDEKLNKLQKKAEDNVKSFHQDNVKHAINTSTECKTIISDLQNIKSRLEKKAKDTSINQLFIDVQLTKQRLSETEKMVKDMDGWDIKRYGMAGDVDLQGLETELSALFAVQEYSAPSTTRDQPRQTRPGQTRRVTTARYQRQIQVKSKDDSKECGISGIAVLSGGRVVVTDFDNYAVKLIDVKKDKVISHVTVSAYPWNVAEIEPNKVAVTCNDSTIIIYNVSNTLSKINVIHVPVVILRGICSYKGNILVVCRGPSCFKLIDMSGTVLKTIDKTNKGEPLPTYPTRIAVYQDHLYVTDCVAHTVTTMTMDGEITCIYKDSTLQYPVGVTVGRQGDVFVCSRDTRTVHQLSPSGHFTQVLLGKDQNLADNPRAIDYSDEHGELYISSVSSKPEFGNYIRVFQTQ